MGGMEIAKMEPDEAREHAAPLHVSVLGEAVVEAFRALPARLSKSWIVDGTVGLGGHAALLLSELPELRLFGIDRDPAALDHARLRLSGHGGRVCLEHGRISELPRLLRRELVDPPDSVDATQRIVDPAHRAVEPPHRIGGMLFDVGVSSLQLNDPVRGFSFQSDGPLDMRMDPTRDRTAAEIVNRWDESDLADLLYYEGGETHARSIARAIVQGRRGAPFLRTLALAETIARAVGHGGRAGRGGPASKIHPATRTFQALRRAVNEEGDELLAALSVAEHWIAPGGRLAVISFHSGEDREVKRFLASGAREGRWEIITKKPIEASLAERQANPRSRSARLRIGERKSAPSSAVEVERTSRGINP
jgi:16S rRNA (cytosine1402-N4)-methyltransferase